jgi:hypothetical protein
MRIVQLTPPGSGCSIVVGSGMGVGGPSASPVTGLHLVVEDIAEARAHLAGRGAEISDVVDLGGVKFASFHDPDGNSWVLQELYRPAPSSS